MKMKSNSRLYHCLQWGCCFIIISIPSHTSYILAALNRFQIFRWMTLQLLWSLIFLYKLHWFLHSSKISQTSTRLLCCPPLSNKLEDFLFSNDTVQFPQHLLIANDLLEGLHPWGPTWARAKYQQYLQKLKRCWNYSFRIQKTFKPGPICLSFHSAVTLQIKILWTNQQMSECTLSIWCCCLRDFFSAFVPQQRSTRKIGRSGFPNWWQWECN